MDTPPAPVVENLTITTILSQSTRFIAANFLHFLALSLFILLPLISHSSFLYSFIPIVYTHRETFVGNIKCNTILTYDDEPYHVLLRLPFLYTLLISPYTLCAFTVINYTTYHLFNGRALNLTSLIHSISSIVSQFITFYIAQLCQHFVGLDTPIFIFRVLVQVFEKNLGFEIDFNSDNMKVYYFLLKLVIQLLFIYLQLIWLFAPLIVVAESKWGPEPLWRSWELINGMRVKILVPLFLVFFYGLLAEVVVWFSWPLTPVLMTLLLLHFSVSINVLYKHCKA